MKSIWQEVIAWMKAIDPRLPAVFPLELPPESSPNFWFRVAQLEMQTRDKLSEKVRSLVTGRELPPMTALEAWLFRRRVEWAGQFALGAVQRGLEPDASLSEVLDWVLIHSWETDGCVALWNHAERGGKSHPENPDGLSPLP